MLPEASSKYAMDDPFMLGGLGQSSTMSNSLKSVGTQHSSIVQV